MNRMDDDGASGRHLGRWMYHFAILQGADRSLVH
jgi:hypothetical protein